MPHKALHVLHEGKVVSQKHIKIQGAYLTGSSTVVKVVKQKIITMLASVHFNRRTKNG